MKKNNTAGVSPFAGYDANKAEQFWKFTLKATGEAVYIFAHTWYTARARVQAFWNCSTEALTAESLDEGEVTIARGSIFVQKDKDGFIEAFQTTRELDREGARRGEGLRKWEPVALEVGRQNGPLAR